MRVCVVPTTGADRPGVLLRETTEDGAHAGPVRSVDDLTEAVRGLEADHRPRWVWADSATVYPVLLAAGVPVARCHDLALTETLLRGHEGRWEPPRSPSGPPDAAAPTGGPGQSSLFDPAVTAEADPAATLEELAATHADQLRRITVARTTSPGFLLLVAAESAAALLAAEMSATGLPWRCDVHDRVLEELLGTRPAHGGRPARLQALAEEVAAALGEPRLNPDSPAELLRVLHRAGVPASSTRRHELHRIDHPAMPPLLRYKELARLHVAHGWAWQEQWVRDGRFHPAYVPGGVVSGRWSSRGGGALQLPRAVRSAVVAGPGQVFVVADAGQLEPRVLAAMSGDPGMAAATEQGDLYAALAVQALGRPEARDEAKVALLSAMYGGGNGSAALAALQRRFPAALRLLEEAAHTGQDGGLVRSVLGRTCPPPRPGWLDGLSEDAARNRARARGRFTRNFVIQASAADWASVLLAVLRTRLSGLDGRARLVFFQHDEVLVETDAGLAGHTVEAIAAAGAEATRLVFGDRGVPVPLDAAVVGCYAEK